MHFFNLGFVFKSVVLFSKVEDRIENDYFNRCNKWILFVRVHSKELCGTQVGQYPKENGAAHENICLDVPG